MLSALVTFLALVTQPAVPVEEPDPQPTVTAPAAEEPTECNGTCVEDQDLMKFVELAQERQCLDKQRPEIAMDPINIVVDNQGRVFFSGSDPRPYKLKIKWCNYEIEAQGKVKVLAAVQEPPTYGFRFRPKAYAGVLLAEPFRKDPTTGKSRSFYEAMDAGLMLDPFYLKDFNLNVHVGFRSVGAGLGMDITKNFGGYVGYALAWDGFRHNPEAALWFAFW